MQSPAGEPRVDTEPASDEAEFRRAVWPEGGPVPQRTLTCRHCGVKNRVRVPDAVLGADRHACGGCKGALFLRADEPLTSLDPAAYEHGLDRKSLQALESIPGLPDLVRWVMSQVGDRSAHLLLMSNAVRCGDDQVPELSRILDLARTRLGITARPPLFVGQSPVVNAMTAGVDQPVILLHSALLDLLSDDELVAVLGHELGHCHAKHALYLQLALLLLVGGTAVSGIARLLAWPLRTALFKWQRCAELTADRAALLATRDLRVPVTLMLKFAGGGRRSAPKKGLSLAPFVRQARELADAESSSWLDSALAGFITMESSHPFAAWRVMHLMQWVEAGKYLDILAGNYPRRDKKGSP